MNTFKELYQLRNFSGVYRIGDAPYEKGIYILFIQQYGYVAVCVDGNESEVYDPKGRLHPSIKEYLKMCNVHSAKYSSLFNKFENEEKIKDFIKSKACQVWEAFK